MSKNIERFKPVINISSFNEIPNEKDVHQSKLSHRKTFPVFAKINEIKEYNMEICDTVLKYSDSSSPNPHPEMKQDEVFLGNFTTGYFPRIG